MAKKSIEITYSCIQILTNEQTVTNNRSIDVT